MPYSSKHNFPAFSKFQNEKFLKGKKIQKEHYKYKFDEKAINGLSTILSQQSMILLV